MGNYVVYVRIESENQAREVVKKLKGIGYNHYENCSNVSLDRITTIAVYDDGEYQFCGYPLHWVSGKIIEADEVLDSDPIRAYRGNKHV